SVLSTATVEPVPWRTYYVGSAHAPVSPPRGTVADNRGATVRHGGRFRDHSTSPSVGRAHAILARSAAERSFKTSAGTARPSRLRGAAHPLLALAWTTAAPSLAMASATRSLEKLPYL